MPSAGWRENVINRLDSLQATLPVKTDKWSPSRPKNAAHSQAKILIEWMPDDLFPPYVEATIDGGIELEWKRDDRELDIEVSATGTIEYLRVLSRATIEEGQLNREQLPSLTTWLLFNR